MFIIMEDKLYVYFAIGVNGVQLVIYFLVIISGKCEGLKVKSKKQGGMPALPRVDRLKTLYSSAKALNDGYKVYGVPKSSCTTRSTPSPHRITIRFDPLSTSSAGVRTVIKTDLTRITSSLPTISFYTQPVRQSKAQLVAEYSNGREVRVNIDGEQPEGVTRYLNHVISRSGDAIVEMSSRQSSKVPSIQGDTAYRSTNSSRSSYSLPQTPTATKYFMNS